MPTNDKDDLLDSMSEAELRRLLKHLRANHVRIFNVALGSLPPLPTGEAAAESSGGCGDVSGANITTPAPTPTDDADIPPASPTSGCYMVYDSDGAKLTLKYSHDAVPGAVGFFSAGPGRKIQSFKFTRNEGRSDLIKNCASGVSGRKNYYSGWCQFVRAARALDGTLTVFPIVVERMGLGVDLFAYDLNGRETIRVPVGRPFVVGRVDAVACLPEHASFFTDLAVDLTKWMTEASTVGAATAFVEIETSDEYKQSISRDPKRERVGGHAAQPTPTAAAVPKNPPRAPAASLEPSSSKPLPDSAGYKKVESCENNSEVPPPTTVNSNEKKEGCYLVYDSDGAKMMLNYSRTEVPRAVGFWRSGADPRKAIKGFKFKRNSGRSELIGNCASGVAGRKNYYSGWCQYVRLARQSDGLVTCLPLTDDRQGLEVDVFFYRKDSRPGFQTTQLVELTPFDSSDPSILAVACLPKHTEFNNYLQLTVDINKWMTEASSIGFASRFEGNK